jgi:hypothetical protein
MDLDAHERGLQEQRRTVHDSKGQSEGIIPLR